MTKLKENYISPWSAEAEAFPRSKIVYESIKEAINGGKGGIFHIDASGGTGKTFVLTTLLSYVPAQGKIGFAMATSGTSLIIFDNSFLSEPKRGDPPKCTFIP